MLLEWMNPGEPHPLVLKLFHASFLFFNFYIHDFIKNTNHEFYCVYRKGPQSYRTPDFSKVEPRVHFPKGGYKPPKSRRSSKRESLSPEPPLVFKSPADIVKEVLLNVSDGSPATSDSYRPPASAPNFTVPQEFRSRRHATMLLEQLQVKVEAESTSTRRNFQTLKHVLFTCKLHF